MSYEAHAISYVECPRWRAQEIKQKLYDVAQATNTVYTTLEETKGLIRMTIRFRFDGSVANLDLVKIQLLQINAQENV